MGRAGLRAPRDRAQPLRRGRPARQGRGLRRGARRMPRRPAGGLLGAWRAEARCRPRPRRRQMVYVDATCPLVSKVHIEAERHHANGLQMVMIGHAGHPETIGTMGQLPPGEVLLVEGVEDVPDRGARPRAAGLHHPDDAQRGRHGRDRRGAARALSRHRRAAQGGHLLRHDQPAGRRSRRWRRRSTRSW
jgi:hypothetical protein